jgi:hypothetical protein
MRYRRPNRAKHGGYPPNVSITAFFLGPFMWIPVLLCARDAGWPAALTLWALLIVSIWVPWEQLGQRIRRRLDHRS